MFGRTGQVDVRELGQLGRGSVVNALRALLLLTLIGFGHACVCSSQGFCVVSINSLVGGRWSSCEVWSCLGCIVVIVAASTDIDVVFFYFFPPFFCLFQL